MGVSADQFDAARAALAKSVRVVEISANDAWMRDVGPTFVVDRRGRVRGIDWMFNAWGGKAGGAYLDWELDDQVAAKVLEIESTPRYRAPFILEGGSIHVDGQGTLLTTEECLLNPNRNPTLRRGQIESLLERYLGVREIIWLGRGVFNDETDGHVDNLCCFVRPGEVVLTWCDEPEDPQYDISRAAFEVLAKAKDARGRKLKIHKLMQPGPLYMTEAEAAGIERSAECKPRRCGDRLAGSYVNFYIANRHIVMPLLDSKTDRAAKTAHCEAIPAAQGHRRALARDPARRRQHPLHHAAAATRRNRRIEKGTSPLSPVRFGRAESLPNKGDRPLLSLQFCRASRNIPQMTSRAPPTRQASSGRTGKPSSP